MTVLLINCTLQMFMADHSHELKHTGFFNVYVIYLLNYIKVILCKYQTVVHNCLKQGG